MNSAVSNLRLHCSPIVKVKFFLFRGARFLSSYFFLSPFLVFLPPLILAKPPTTSLLSLSLSLYSTFYLPLRWNLGRSIKASWSLSQWFFFFFFFLVCDLMVDSVVVVWVTNLAGMGISVKGRSAWLWGSFYLFFSSLLTGSLSFFSPMERGGGGLWIMAEICSD